MKYIIFLARSTALAVEPLSDSKIQIHCKTHNTDMYFTAGTERREKVL